MASALRADSPSRVVVHTLRGEHLISNLAWQVYQRPRPRPVDTGGAGVRVDDAIAAHIGAPRSLLIQGFSTCRAAAAVKLMS